MPFVVERILRPTPNLRPLLGDFKYNAKPFDYRTIMDISGLAKRVASRDRLSESVPAWTRTIRRWVTQDKGLEPDTCRRFLDALGFDWVVGLGRCGFQQHAISMLHASYTHGGRDRVISQARATFPGSDFERGRKSDHEADSFTIDADQVAGKIEPNNPRSAFQVDVPYLNRLHKHAISCWGEEDNGRIVPTRCCPPTRPSSVSRTLLRVAATRRCAY